MEPTNNSRNRIEKAKDISVYLLLGLTCAYNFVKHPAMVVVTCISFAVFFICSITLIAKDYKKENGGLFYALKNNLLDVLAIVMAAAMSIALLVLA